MAGGDAAPNAPVTFTAHSSEACTTFINGLTRDTNSTNASGIAASTARTANAAAGEYSVTAMMTGLAAGASFSLTNVKAPVPSIGKSYSGNFIQGQSGASYTVTVSNAAGAGWTTRGVTVTKAGGGGDVGIDEWDDLELQFTADVHHRHGADRRILEAPIWLEEMGNRQGKVL
jgi:hypothetical protein